MAVVKMDKQKVLIADDEPKIRQGLKSVLEEMKLPIVQKPF